jgi:hypothetical protein
MSSSFEEAIAQIRKWVAAKPAPKIRAMFTSSGFTMYARGFISINAEDLSDLFLVLIGEDGKLLMTVPFAAITVEDSPVLTPLIDAPDSLKFEMDFLVRLSLCLPDGRLDLDEIAG